MDMNLRLPSGELEKEESEQKELLNILDAEHKLHNEDRVSRDMVDVDRLHAEDDVGQSSPTADMVDYKEDMNLEPLAGMEFESHGDAYDFYQEYARSMGFTTAIQNSRRSKTSREFIDAKFACSKYGTKREYDKSSNRPRSRQGNKQDPENASGRRSCSKTDCKASMHVKRRPDGKWIIHRFEKEHNHELSPAQAVSEQTRKMYAAMARQFAEYKNVVGLKNDSKSPFEKGRNLSLEVGEANILLDFFMQMQSLNSNFFYAIDVSEDQHLKSMFWADAKSRYDYINFSDVVSFDTTYVRNKYKMPLSLFIGVNQHYQFMLLGCALLSDESVASFSWVMQAWLTAMGGMAPKVIITDKDPSIESAISEVLPSTNHCFGLWHVVGKMSETLTHVTKQNEKFMPKLEKCIFRSWTSDEFEKRWHKIVERFGLKENEWIQSLNELRNQWVPTYMKDVLLAGMSTFKRSESLNCFFDKYVHKKTSVQEFLRQYEAILQDRYEEEAKAESDTWNKPPLLKSPSPFEKHMSSLYTHAVFKKFQDEVLGAIGCMPKREKQEETISTYRVHDTEKNQDFIVSWDATKSEVSCVCRLFEFKGFLCRHAMIVLQICGHSAIPSQYILKRWTREAKNMLIGEESEQQMQSRVQRYNDLSQRSLRLSEEGSLSHESYTAAVDALKKAVGNCVGANNSNKNLIEDGTSPGLLFIEEDNQSRSMRTNKKKNPTKKKKLNTEPDIMTVGPQDSLQQLDKLSSRQVTLDGYFGSQPTMPGMLNLMAPARDNYYTNPQAIQGLGQLNTIAPNHDSYYGPPPTMLGQMDFLRTQGFSYGIREDPNVRTTQLHDNPPRHP